MSEILYFATGVIHLPSAVSPSYLLSPWPQDSDRLCLKESLGLAMIKAKPAHSSSHRPASPSQSKK